MIERSTLHRKKNTYSIAHISNINMEQNLFELMIHTCRLKLDMENASDADSTDISILLSLQKAQELKSLLLASSIQENENNQKITTASAKETYASFSQILVHCICRLPGYYMVLFSLFAAFLAFVLSDGEFTFSDLLFKDSGSSFFMKTLAVGVLIITYGYQFTKRLLAFYHFSAFRQGNDIIIHYGFFRKQDYTIPVDCIHGLQIVQAPLARLAGRLEARMICIGIGDTKEELTQLSLCQKKTPFFDAWPNFCRNFLYPP